MYCSGAACVATETKSLTSAAPNTIHSEVQTKWQTLPVPQLWKWTVSGAGPPALMDRSHRSSLFGPSKAPNMPRLKAPQPQGQPRREAASSWLNSLCPLSHFYSTLFHSISLSSASAFASVHPSSLLLPSFIVYIYSIFTRVHITAVWGRGSSSGEGKPLEE